MILPQRIKLSKKSTEKLRYLKTNTGLTPNIISRIAIMLAIKEGGDLTNAGVSDYDGQELSRDVLFGEHQLVYQILISEYISQKSVSLSMSQTITAMIEVGVFKLGHVKSLKDLALV